MGLVFGTKAETLETLVSYVHRAKILPQIRFVANEWIQKPDEIVKKIIDMNWDALSLVVRSSAISEDLSGNSLAGHYTSILNVSGLSEIKIAVDEVIASMSDFQLDQVFVQPMLKNVLVSGVVFTRDPNISGYYYVINYDDASGSTTTITSGNGTSSKVFYAVKQGNVQAPDQLRPIIEMTQELETIFPNKALDIEFAITDEGIYLLQVRPLICNETTIQNEEYFCRVIKDIYNKVNRLNQEHPYLYGKRTILGVMPDWNPAEMIGIRPRPLALSLYKDLITDSIWAFQRSNYGYRNMRSFPLLINLYGIPFIDVRTDFNSFVPASLEQEIAERLVNYYLDRLEENPHFHDKVEFEIVYTCYTFDLPQRIQKLREYGFTGAECERIVECLRTITNEIINDTNGHWRQDIQKIEKLAERHKVIMESSLDTVSKIYWLLEDCKRYGTLPFAGLARAAFIATQIMQSMVSVGLFDREEYQNFMSELDGVGTKMNSDFFQLNRNDFLEKYGHLRPGTYDILSPRYDEEPDRYFQWEQVHEAAATKQCNSFMLSIEQIRKMQHLLSEHLLEHNLLGLLDFIKTAIESREHAKYVFTRSLSDALSLFKQVGQEHGFTVDECSFAKIDCIKTMYDSCCNAYEVLEKSIQEGKMEYEVTKHINLPPVILRPEEVWSFEMPEMEPNYITLMQASGAVVFADDNPEKFNNAILMIPCADPGFDWVFSHGIAGFITMYGGANSHMAVRAGEMGIPAVIGAGELLYNKWSTANDLEINCVNRQVKIIK